MFFNCRYKLNIYHERREESGRLEGELHDMQNDPTETINLWRRPAHAELRTRLPRR